MAGPKRSVPAEVAPATVASKKVQLVQALEPGYHGLTYRAAGSRFAVVGEVPSWCKVVKKRPVEDE